MVIPLVLVVSIIGIVGVQESFAEETWYSGENLKQGDYFSFQLCDDEYKDCTPFQIDLWIEKEIQEDSESRWLTKVMIFDGAEIMEGKMELRASSAEPIRETSKITHYIDAFRFSVTAISVFSSMTSPGQVDVGPRSLDEGTKWRSSINIGSSVAHIVGTQTIQTPAGIFDAVLLQWNDKENENKIWVVDQIPFPIKAKVWVPTADGNPIKEFEFELLDYRENISEDPFAPVAYTEEPFEAKLSLRQQMKTGMLSFDIVCRGDLQLIFKPSDNSPACVKPQTAEKLIQRGWTTP